MEHILGKQNMKHNKTYLITAMHSDSGKTLFTFGLLKLLTDFGYAVQSFKTGPDYIDPMYHRYITNHPCYNLDPFFLEPKESSALRALFLSHVSDADFAIIEGAMGYFDGIYGEGRRGSASVVADEVDAEVIFLVDEGDSVFDVLQYLQRFSGTTLYGKPYQNRVKYLILNRSCEQEFQTFKKAWDASIQMQESLMDMQVIGWIPKKEAFKMERRHLGLYTCDAQKRRNVLAKEMKEAILKYVEIEKLFPDISKRGIVRKKIGQIRNVEQAKCVEQIDNTEQANRAGHLNMTEAIESAGRPLHLGIAKDRAFCFFYEDNLELLQEAGFSIQYFSPLEDDGLPKDLDLLWIPGGYPELFANELHENISMRQEIQSAAKCGLPMIAECGGFMYLHTRMEDMQRKRFDMCDVITGDAFLTEKLQRFGYIEVQARTDTLLLQEREKMRGHEFHYFDSTSNGEDALATKANGLKSWDCVHGNTRLFAGFPHIYLRSNPRMLVNLVEACKAYRMERERHEQTGV